ncbi:hypothetical protein [Bifidobacterium pluvialisilvae]|uniref:hypothetical protein n=1 Tax=Bifidobacterium pluvialisilvae TaxID=2834436 RepID=UPI001F31A3BB|nr:hypothetical protein [Bifidobacterium pluvialisilvae]
MGAVNHIFVKLLAGHVYDGAFRQAIMEKFRPLVKKALKRYLNDQVNDRLKAALGADDIRISSGGDAQSESDENPDDNAPAESEPDDGIVTTEEEIAAYRIIKAIACSEADPERITMRDSKSYCAVFLDDNNRKPVARLFFNTKQKYIGLFDENKKCERYPIDNLNGIYLYAEQIRAEVQCLLQ